MGSYRRDILRTGARGQPDAPPLPGAPLLHLRRSQAEIILEWDWGGADPATWAVANRVDGGEWNVQFEPGGSARTVTDNSFPLPGPHQVDYTVTGEDINGDPTTVTSNLRSTHVTLP